MPKFLDKRKKPATILKRARVPLQLRPKTRRTAKPLDLVIVGHIGFDIIRSSAGRKKVVGGAAYFGAKGAAIHSKNVGVVTRIGKDFNLKFLANLGIDLSGVKVITGKSPIFSTTYRRDFEVSRFRARLGVGSMISAPDIPKQYLSAKHIHVATMPPQQQAGLIEALKRKGCRAKISVDTIEAYVRRNPEAIRRVLVNADIIFVNQREYELLRQLNVFEKKTVVRKKGAGGAEVQYEGKVHSVNAPTVKIVVDPTGAGDILAGAFLTLVSKGEHPKRALQKAVKIASQSVQQFGVEHL